MIGWIYSLTHDPITRYTVKNIRSDNGLWAFMLMTKAFLLKINEKIII